MSLFSARDLAKSWGGIAAVQGVSFGLDAGEMAALIGPNGAGKSTCFAMLGGQVKPDRGDIRLDGRRLSGDPAAFARAGVARGFQIAKIFASMSVRENVQTALLAARRRVWRFGQAADRQLVAEADALLARVALADLAERDAAALAYGDTKRLELAIALAGRPRVLLLDEPTSGMAQADRAAAMRLIAGLAAEGIGVLFTEHDMDAVFGFAARVLVMDRGRLVAEGTPAEISANPVVRAVYLGEREVG
jgi:branched-chain amino acid transport system ATP-binding protein